MNILYCRVFQYIFIKYIISASIIYSLLVCIGVNETIRKIIEVLHFIVFISEVYICYDKCNLDKLKDKFIL